MRKQRTALAAPVAALFIGAVVLIAAFAYASLSPKQATSTSTLIAPSASTAVGSSARTSYSSTTSASTTNSSSSLPARCSSAVPPVSQGLLFGSVVAGTSSPAILCFQLYYFAASPKTFNLTKALSIEAVKNGGGAQAQVFSGASNFTVSSNQEEVMMGGSANLGEGTFVAYSIQAKPGASGTYELGFAPLGVQNTLLIDSQEPVGCSYFGQLVAGDGSPNYVFPGGCVTISSSYYCSSTNPHSNAQCNAIPDVSYPLVPGYFYFRVVGVANSTQ